jgi:hypothetical protein
VVKHTITEKVRKRTDYCCSTSPGGIRVIVFIFYEGKHYGIDNQMNGREDRGSVKESYSWGDDKDIWG